MEDIIGLLDIFKTEVERDIERKAFIRKNYENSIGLPKRSRNGTNYGRLISQSVAELSDQIVCLKQKCLEQWQEAFDHLKSGNRRQAESKILELRLFEWLLFRHELKLNIVEQYKQSLTPGHPDPELRELIEKIRKSKVLDQIEKSSVSFLSGVSSSEEMITVLESGETFVPSREEMMKALESIMNLEVSMGKTDNCEETDNATDAKTVAKRECFFGNGSNDAYDAVRLDILEKYHQWKNSLVNGVAKSSCIDD